MLLIQGWTDDTDQTMRVTLPDGSLLTLELYFRQQQQGWFITQLLWNTFSLYGLRITNNVNLLLSWKNLLNFGLCCLTADGREPSLAQDFSSGSSNLYIVTSSELLQLDALLAGISS